MHTKISMENDFLPIFSPIFHDLCHFKQLWKRTPFFLHFFRFPAIFPPPTCGGPWVNIFLLYYKTTLKNHKAFRMRKFLEKSTMKWKISRYLHFFFNCYWKSIISSELMKNRLKFNSNFSRVVGSQVTFGVWVLGLLDKSLSNMIVFYVFIGIF